MQVRIMIGPKAGGIVGVAPQAARAMLADGRALPAYDLFGQELPIPVRVETDFLVEVASPSPLDPAAEAECKPAFARLKGAKK